MTQDACELRVPDARGQGHRDGSGLVDPHVRHQPLERLVVREHEGDAISPGDAEPAKPMGDAVGLPVPPGQGELGAVGDIPPRNTVGMGARQAA